MEADPIEFSAQDRADAAGEDPAGGPAEEGLRQALLRVTSPGYAALRAELETLRGQIEALGVQSEARGERSAQEARELRALLEELRALLVQLEGKLADPQAESERVTPVLVPVLAERARAETEALAEAVAPVIGPAIRHQIRASRQDIIDSLYPLIGQIIGKSISEALRELTRNIDARLRTQFNLGAQLRHLSARLRGVSEAELLLREALPYSIRQVFLIHRQSGLLLAHLSPAGEAPADSDVISGMLTAIRDFVRESFGRGEEELEEITYGDQRVLLEGGKHAYLAVVLAGVEPPGYYQLMETVIHAIHLQHESALGHFAGDMEALPDLRKPLSPLLAPALTVPAEAAPPAALSRSQKLAIGFGLGGIILLLALVAFTCVFTTRLWSYAFPGPSPTPTSLPLLLPSATQAPPTPIPTLTPTAIPSPTATPAPLPTATVTSTIPSSPALPIFLTSGFLNLRTEPTRSGRILGTLTAGEPVIVLERQGDWAHVQWPAVGPAQLEGWVWDRYLLPSE